MYHCYNRITTTVDRITLASSYKNNYRVDQERRGERGEETRNAIYFSMSARTRSLKRRVQFISEDSRSRTSSLPEYRWGNISPMAHHRLRDAGRMEVAEGTALPWLNPFVPDNYFQCCYRWPSYIFCDRRGEPTSVAWLAVPAGRRIHLRPKRSEVPPRVNEAGLSGLNIISIYYPVFKRTNY